MKTEKNRITICDLAPNPKNPRKISHKKSDMLNKSMREFGDLSGIVYNICTKQLVGGHQRTKNFDPSWPIAKKKYKDSVGTVAVGEIKTPFGIWAYREVDWPKEKESMANIAANQQGGEFNDIKLKEILMEISNEDIDLIGFTQTELDQLLDDKDSSQKSELLEEMELKPFENYDYLVVLFDNIIDWQYICEKLEIKRVISHVIKKSKK